jgi:hypothetical protein
MRQHMANAQRLSTIIDQRDQPVLVASDVKNDGGLPAGNMNHVSISSQCAHLCEIVPSRFSRDLEPFKQRRPRYPLGAPFPECLKRLSTK